MNDFSSEVQALSPVHIPRAKPGVKWNDPAVVNPFGVPLNLASPSLGVYVDPPAPPALSIELFLNGKLLDVPQQEDADGRTQFKVPRALLREGAHALTYKATRASGNAEESPPMWVLYSRNRPGGTDPVDDDNDIHEGLGIDLPKAIKQTGVGPEEAARGVPLTVSYAFAKLHDVVTVDCNGFAFEYTVTQDDLGGAFDITLPEAAFIGGGNSKAFPIFYSVQDQLGNTAQDSLPSATLSIAVDLTPKEATLPAPFVPALVGNAISPIKYTAGFVVRVDWAAGFKAGDKAKLVVTGGGAGDGTPKFEYVAFNANARANFQLKREFILANGNKEVVFKWVLLRNGQETESKPLTLQIEIVNVTDPNVATPEIVEAYGMDTVDLRAFTDDAQIVCAPWPLIGEGQKYWLHVLGTGTDDNPKTVAIAVGKTLTEIEIQNGLDHVLSRKELELFKPGNQLRVRLRVDFYPNENADTILTFTLKRYTLVTAGMRATLEFLNAPYRVAPLGRLTNIELKLVDENGEFIKEVSVFVTLPNNFKYADGTTGRREFKTSLFGESVIRGVTGPDAPSTAYTIKAEYNGKAVSAELNVTARGKIGEVGIKGETNPSIAISPDGTRIYIWNANRPNILVVDSVSLEEVGRLECPVVNDFFVSAGSEYVYVSTDGRIDVIRVEPWQKITDFTVSTARSCVFGVDGMHSYFVGTDRLYIVDNAKFRIKEQVPVNYSWWWDHIAHSLDGRRIYVAGLRANSQPSLHNIHVFDTITNKIVKSSGSLKKYPRSLKVSPDGKFIYVGDDKGFTVYDSVSLTEIRSFDAVSLSQRYSLLSSNGRLLYFLNEKGKVSAIDTVSLQVVKSFEVAGSLCWLSLSPDDSRLYVAYSDNPVLTAIQVE